MYFTQTLNCWDGHYLCRGGGGKKIGGPRLFYISKEGGLLLFSGTKIRGGNMIQQEEEVNSRKLDL